MSQQFIYNIQFSVHRSLPCKLWSQSRSLFSGPNSFGSIDVSEAIEFKKIICKPEIDTLLIVVSKFGSDQSYSDVKMITPEIKPSVLPFLVYAQLYAFESLTLLNTGWFEVETPWTIYFLLAEINVSNMVKGMVFLLVLKVIKLIN